MTTIAEMLAFIRGQARVTSTDEETVLINAINEAFLRLCRKSVIPYPGLKTSASITTITNTQNYDLPANFDRLLDDGIRYDTGNAQWPEGRLVNIVYGDSANIWEAMGRSFWPGAVTIVAGSTPGRKAIRFLPYFTDTPRTATVGYVKRPTTYTTGSDVLEVPELAEAVCLESMRTEKVYSRDPVFFEYLTRNAKEARWGAEATLR